MRGKTTRSRTARMTATRIAGVLVAVGAVLVLTGCARFIKDEIPQLFEISLAPGDDPALVLDWACELYRYSAWADVQLAGVEVWVGDNRAERGQFLGGAAVAVDDGDGAVYQVVFYGWHKVKDHVGNSLRFNGDGSPRWSSRKGDWVLRDGALTALDERCYEGGK